MLFGFAPQVRTLFTLTALLMAVLALAMMAFAIPLWRRGEGKTFDRSLLSVIVVITLVYAGSIGVLGG
jgi:hypothetical protein